MGSLPHCPSVKCNHNLVKKIQSQIMFETTYLFTFLVNIDERVSDLVK